MKNEMGALNAHSRASRVNALHDFWAAGTVWAAGNAQKKWAHYHSGK